MLNLTKIISLTLVFVLLAPSAFAKKTLQYPYGCYPSGYKFKNYVLFLTPNKKYHEQSIYFIHNKANFPLNVRQIHPGNSPYIIYLNTTIRPKYWAVLAMDQEDMKFICTVNKKGLELEQILDCSKYLELCEYPFSRFGDNMRGNYWFLQSRSMNTAKNATNHGGVLLIDPKKVRQHKREQGDDA